MKISYSKFDFEREKAEFHIDTEIDDVDDYDITFQIREPGPHRVAWIYEIDGPEVGIAEEVREQAIEIAEMKMERFGYRLKSKNPNLV